MIVHWPSVLNLANSIIGCSILSIPFCFRQTGLLLGTGLLGACVYLTIQSCRLLMKASIVTKKRSYEHLALHLLGPAGKLTYELSCIGMLIGVCIAFYIVIGDIAPAIVSNAFSIENSWSLRFVVLTISALCVALPLGLMRNIQSLSHVSACSIVFYVSFTVLMFYKSLPHLFTGTDIQQIDYVKLSGMPYCIPIFALAFCAHTQLFAIFETFVEPTLKKMDAVIVRALIFVCTLYTLVGLFGYISFGRHVNGDVLTNLPVDFMTETARMCFALSVAVSFPLIIFPCRASIDSLIFQKEHTLEAHTQGTVLYIPPRRFNTITALIVISTLMVALVIPHVEMILGLTGATMGVLISFILPPLLYMKLPPSNRDHFEEKIAKVLLGLGIVIAVLGTFTSLTAQSQPLPEISQQQDLDLMMAQPDNLNLVENNLQPQQEEVQLQPAVDIPGDAAVKDTLSDSRLEPALPKAPEDNSNDLEKLKRMEGDFKEIKEQVEVLLDEGKAVDNEVQAAVAVDNPPELNDDKEKVGEVIQGEAPQDEGGALIEKLKETQELQEKLIVKQQEMLDELDKQQQEQQQVVVDNVLVQAKVEAAVGAGLAVGDQNGDLKVNVDKNENLKQRQLQQEKDTDPPNFEDPDSPKADPDPPKADHEEDNIKEIEGEKKMNTIAQDEGVDEAPSKWTTLVGKTVGKRSETAVIAENIDEKPADETVDEEDIINPDSDVTAVARVDVVDIDIEENETVDDNRPKEKSKKKSKEKSKETEIEINQNQNRDLKFVNELISKQ